LENGKITFEDTKFSGVLHFKNFGNRPAYNLAAYIHGRILNSADPVIINSQPFPDPQNRTSKGIFGSGTTFQLSAFDDFAKYMPVGEVPKLLKRVSAGDSSFFVRGDLSYEDTFGAKWELVFEYEAVRDADGNWTLRPTRSGNAERKIT
jgi:hypothetical protein